MIRYCQTTTFNLPNIKVITIIEPEDIITAVCNYTGVSYELLMTPTQKRNVVETRQLAMYFVRKYQKGITDKAIGKLFGRDRTSVIYSVETVNDIMGTNRLYKNKVENLHTIIKKAQEAGK